MNPQAIKLDLIHWLTDLKDKKLLELFASIKESSESGDWYSTLTEGQKKSLERGVEDHKNGRFLSSGEFWSRYEKKA